MAARSPSPLRQSFRKADLRRAFEAALEAGFKAASVRLGADGALEISASNIDPAAAPAPLDAWEARINGQG
jgi:hypothetical protein